MRSITLIITVFLVTPIAAADLTKIERSIRKQPVYQSKTPKYCLLVFGPEAKTRVWLVLDGDRLFVDRNGNGDLTDEGEPVAGLAGRKELEENLFEIGEIRAGARTHKNMTLRIRKIDYLAVNVAEVKQFLAKHPGAKGYALTADVEIPGWKGDGEGGRILQGASFHDTRGVLAFADQPQEAPILHFGGPWQVRLYENVALAIGRETELNLVVGTAGLGAGSTVMIAYDGVIPENRFPRVEISYPAKNPAEKPIQQLYELKARC